MSVQVQEFINHVRGKLIVSCQALPGTPLDHPKILAAIAQAVELGGASALRADGARNIIAMSKATRLPIIGIRKTANRKETYITPRFEHAQEIAWAGADIIALQATMPRLGDCTPLNELIARIHSELGLGVIADISTLAEAEAAMAAGADLVATTLSGYTPHTAHRQRPDTDLVYEIAKRGIPVIAEGNYQSPEQVVGAMNNGAIAVVVGTFITMPDRITRHFVKTINEAEPGSKGGVSYETDY